MNRRRDVPTPTLSLPVVLAALAFDLALVPTLLPRPWWVNGVFVGVSAAQTFLLAVGARWTGRVVLGWARPRGPAARRTRWCHGGSDGRPGGRRRRTWSGAALLTLLVTSAVAGQLKQAGLERSMQLPPGSFTHQAMHQSGAVGVGLLTAALLVGLVLLAVRALRAALREAVRVFARSRRLRAATLVPVVTIAGCTVSVPWGPTSTPASAAVAASRPAAPAVGREAGAVVVSEGSLGAKGHQFLRGTTPSSVIARVTGEAARRPVRVYAELRAGEGDEARAARGVAQLRGSGALDRSAVLVVVPTGSGWVDPAAVTAVETLTGGDVATLAVQYADVPSWVAYLRGAGSAERSAAAVIRDVRSLLDTVPVERRPRLLVYGESLGALGGLRALVGGASGLAGTGGSGLEDVDGALWVGVPADVARLGHRAGRRGQAVLVHRDDPVAAWSATLAVRPAAGWRAPWWPVVTFWQATADLVSAYSTPDGYGHRYGAELVDAWRPVLARAGVGSPVTVGPATGGEMTLTVVRHLVSQTSDGGSSLPSRAPEG
ncbi:MAG TPA: alpha/beta-hydrolase family protein [Actinomycetales bacterium]|nr:alpha/beta-hydrolase family protein [Actinomycetales bacterium]